MLCIRSTPVNVDCRCCALQVSGEPIPVPKVDPNDTEKFNKTVDDIHAKVGVCRWLLKCGAKGCSTNMAIAVLCLQQQ